MSGVHGIQVFYDPRQVATGNNSYSPSAEKPAAVVASWRELALRISVDLCFPDFSPSTLEQLYGVHDRKYVDGVLSLRRKNGFGNKSAAVAASLPWVCGSAVAATLAAWRERQPTFSPTSGAHHAFWDSGGGFCTFNSLMLAAVEAHRAGASRIGILDLDCHYGDGTDDIIRYYSIDFIQHYSFGKDVIHRRQIPAWLANLPKVVESFAGCQVVLFNAGVDPHVADPLGGFLTSSELRARDLCVYRGLRDIGVPVVTMLAGGYQRDENGSIRPVLELHDQTFAACVQAHFPALLSKLENLKGEL